MARNISFNKEVDPEIINGILTVSVILFGLSSFSLGGERRPDTRFKEAILFIIFVYQAIVLAFAGNSYFGDYLKNGYATVETLLFALISLDVNIFTWLLTFLLRVRWGMRGSPFKSSI